MARSILTFIIIALAAGGAPAGTGKDPAVKASVSPEKATVGAVLDYRVTIAGPGLGGVTVVPPEQREYIPRDGEPLKSGEAREDGEEDASRLVPLYIIHSVKKDDRSEGGVTDITVTAQISFYRPGKYGLPAIEIRGADGVAIGYRIPEVEIRAVNKKGEFMEIEEPLDLGGNYWRLAFLLLGAALLATAAFFAWRYFRKRMVEARAAVPAVPPIDIFLGEIRNLDGERLIGEGRVEEYVFGISLIFRKFLSLHFGFDAMEMTTYEIEKKLRRIFPGAVRDRHFEGIMTIMSLWDLSKFAEFMPSKEALADNLRATVGLARQLAGEKDDDLPRV